MLKIGEFSKLAQVSPKTLRLYDERGLLKPAWIDRFTGYRYYQVQQLATLNRILAFKDLGFSLDQIVPLQRDDLPVSELRGMIRLKQAELEQHIQGEQARLARIETRLQLIERKETPLEFEVVIKRVPALRVAGIRDKVPSIGDVFPLLDELQNTLHAQGIVAQSAAPPLALYYDTVFKDRGLDIEVALPLQQKLAASARMHIHELPAVETMACLLHRGPYAQVREAYQALIHWIDSSGYRIEGPNRDVVLQRPSAANDLADAVTEVQFPIKQKPFLSVVPSFKEQKRMDIKIITKPAFTVSGMSYFGKNENGEIPQMWDQFLPRQDEIEGKLDPQRCYGICSEVDTDGRFRYLAGYEVKPGSEPSPNMENWDVPEQTYALFPSTLQTIHETYNYAFQTWLPESDYEHVKDPDFEFYDADFDPAKGTGLYIYIPVKKK